MVFNGKIHYKSPIFKGPPGRSFSELVELQLARQAELWEPGAGGAQGAQGVSDSVLLDGPRGRLYETRRDFMGFYGGLMEFYGGFMGFYGGLMGFYGI